MTFELDHVLLRLSPQDFWTVADACEGTQVFGATGSGKTSGSGQAIAKSMLRAGFGGLVLTAKPDERALWERYAAETGRADSLLVFGIDHPHRFNFLDYELRRSTSVGLTENLVALFTTVMEAAEGSSGQSGNDPFWPRALRQLLRNAIDLLVLSTGVVRLPDLVRVVTTAPQHSSDLGDRTWQQHSFCFQCLVDADARTTNPVQLNDLAVTTAYWCEEFPGLAERTRSSVVATFTTMADGLIRGQLRELFCTSTNVVPELTHHGTILVVDLPVKTFHELGRFAQILWKYCWQRATEARDVTANPRPTFLWADEAQLFLTAQDQQFQGTARSAKACTVYLTQNLPSYYTAMGGPSPKAAADSLLGVLQTKIFHANGDAETNEWAERTVAKQWSPRTTTSSSDKPADPKKPGSGQGKSFNTSTGQSFESALPAREFTLLKKGGPDNGFTVDAIVFQGGRVWKQSGTNFLRTAFSQLPRKSKR